MDMAYMCKMANAPHVYWYAPKNVKLFGKLLMVRLLLA